MNQADVIMTQLKKSGIRGMVARHMYPRRIYASLLMLIMPVWLMGQNIYDESHSREFAKYLLQTQQYQLATSELERILFFSPGDTLVRLNLLKSFRLSQKPAESWQKLNQWYPTGSLSRAFSLEGIQTTLIQSDFPSFLSVIERSTGLTSAEKSNYELGSYLLEGNWINKPMKSRESSFGITATDPRLLVLYGKTKTVHRKSPAASAALSAMVPGLGKVYSHDWKDGLLSLVFVATNAWQSYRGFSKKGASSVSGWIFGSLAFGFYSANIFGSWKSAKTYNSKQVELIRHETEGTLFNH